MDLVAKKMRANLFYDCLSNVILICENVVQSPVLVFVPELIFVRGIFQLNVDADAVPGEANAAF